MLTNIFYLVLAVACFFWMAKTSINFSPYSIQFQELPKAIGMFLILIGIGFVEYNSQVVGARKFRDELIKELEKKVESGELTKTVENE